MSFPAAPTQRKDKEQTKEKKEAGARRQDQPPGRHRQGADPGPGREAAGQIQIRGLLGDRRQHHGQGLQAHVLPLPQILSRGRPSNAGAARCLRPADARGGRPGPAAATDAPKGNTARTGSASTALISTGRTNRRSATAELQRFLGLVYRVMGSGSAVVSRIAHLDKRDRKWTGASLASADPSPIESSTLAPRLIIISRFPGFCGTIQR